jgi:hypothetical protein
MKEIILTQGQDDEDFEYLNQHAWQAVKSRGVFYAKTGSHRVSMSRMILNIDNKKVLVDHINHNTLDNRKENLRLCNSSQNQQNKKKEKGTSKYKGVYWHKQTNKWKAQITLNGKRTSLGYFEKEEDAGKAYVNAAQRNFGEFICVK